MVKYKDRNYKNVTAHRMISHLCNELAQELYEELASKSDDFFKNNMDRNHFVRTAAPELKPAAITILGHMLERNDVSEIEKNQIYEALVNDRSLHKGGTSITERIH